MRGIGKLRRTVLPQSGIAQPEHRWSRKDAVVAEVWRIEPLKFIGREEEQFVLGNGSAQRATGINVLAERLGAAGAELVEEVRRLGALVAEIAEGIAMPFVAAEFGFTDGSAINIVTRY